MPRLQSPANGPPWLPAYTASIEAAFKQRLSAPIWLWGAATADLPTLAGQGANEGALAYDDTLNTLTVYNGSAWSPLAAIGGDTTYLFRANNLSDLANAGTARTNLGLGTGNSPTFFGLTVTNGISATGTGPSDSSTIVFRGTSGGATSVTGLRLMDTDDSHTLRLACNSDLTANRTLRIASGDTNRNLDISAVDVTISAAGANLIDDADAAAQRSTLGLGTAAVKNTGTSGNTVPLLDGASATWTNGADFGDALRTKGIFRSSGTIGSLGSDFAGPACEIAYSGGVAVVAGYDRTGAAYQPISIIGLSVEFSVSGTPLLKLSGAFGNYANDAAAAVGGVAVGEMYRNGSVLMVRVA